MIDRIKGLLRRYAGSQTERSPVAVAQNPDALLEYRVRGDLFDRPHFAYGVFHAARQAQRLGMERISVVELGVAGGAGLLALERIAGEIGREVGVGIEPWGFDLGAGMPVAVDYRDCPYIWKPEYFTMDEDALRSKLTTAHLVIGDVAKTIPATVEQMAPIGFVSFDLDYYSSTVAAFRIFDAPHLPRAFCYFDDIVGDDDELHCEFTGELLAIAEYNASHEDRKLAKIHGLAAKRQIRSAWNEMMFVHHDFGHPAYTTHIGRADWQLPVV